MNPYLVVILIFIVGQYLLNIIIARLGISSLQPELPEEFIGYADAEKYKLSQQYLKENTAFQLIVDTVMTALTLIFIVGGGFNIVDSLVRGFGVGSIFTGMLYIALVALGMHLVHLPFTAYSTFHIESKYGFNRTTLKTFLADMLKTLLLAGTLGGLMIAAILWLFEQAGIGAWFYCWITVTLLQLVLLFLAPAVILPLFNRFEPLEEGPVKTAIEAYARLQRFTIRGVFTMDGSRRSTKSNAFFTGFGRYRRIVLFDTLISKHSADELVAIVAHEIGHCRKRHLLVHLAVSVLTTGSVFLLLAQFINNRGLFAAFQMEHTSIYASLVFFGFLYTPVSLLLSIFSNAVARRHEYEADNFAVATTGKAEAMIAALKKLSIDNLSNLTPHPFQVALAYSHPPVLERTRRIRAAGPV